MLFDILAAIQVTASAAIIAATLAFMLSQTVTGRLRMAFALGAWFAIVVVFGATMALDNQAGIGTPGLGAAVALPILILCFAFFGFRRAREAMTAIPLSALITVNIVRVVGYEFVLLYLAQRLPSPFAPVAGWGDVFVGVTAIPMAWIATRGGERARMLVLGWNLIGFLDLVAAIFLGATSSPGPLRIFMDPPSSAIMTTLPWIIIPCFIVPCLGAIHIAIFYRLSRRAGRPEASTQLDASRPADTAAR